MLGELAKAIKKVSEENKDGKCQKMRQMRTIL